MKCEKNRESLFSTAEHWACRRIVKATRPNTSLVISLLNQETIRSHRKFGQISCPTLCGSLRGTTDSLPHNISLNRFFCNKKVEFLIKGRAMEGQSVVVIHDASREINVRIFEWSLQGLSLVAGDMLTLIAVMHQVITPMGYKSSVDSRLMFGANQKIVEAQAARKKKEYMNNKHLAQIFQLYKSEKVGFKIETAIGSSLKAVAVKSALKLKATWLILDRKMKNDEEYFLQKLSCGILRVRRFNKIIRLREPLHLPHEKRPGSSTHETLTDSTVTDYPMNQRQNSPHDEAWYSTPDQLSTEKKNNSIKQMDEEPKTSRNHGMEKDLQPKQKSVEKNCDISCSGSNSETKQKNSYTLSQNGEKLSSLGGAKNFFLGKAEEYILSEKFFSLSNFHVRN
ncbi:unnamed protein product [Sphenostylis stenocarpa]|uniref:Uncharacterized protein n=1 Tax=Sphenostylis stenocarpa TaxID=92480 RepID=A0AA86SYT1_9FABA|nr:unnamed protein product [Sphenostylis stenocarpa]